MNPSTGIPLPDPVRPLWQTAGRLRMPQSVCHSSVW